VIWSFRDKEAELLYNERLPSKRLRPFADSAYRKLFQLAQAKELRDLNLPGNRLEKLAGDRLGQYSIRINQRWRICFEWRQGDAHQVEIVDYH
jgi:proteic killer suppression protein